MGQTQTLLVQFMVVPLGHSQLPLVELRVSLTVAAWSDADGRALTDSLGGRSVVHAVEWTLTQQRLMVQDESPLSSSELR